MTWRAYFDGTNTIINCENITLVYECFDVSQLPGDEILKLEDSDSRKLIDNGYSLLKLTNRSKFITGGLSIQELYAQEGLQKLSQEENPNFETICELLERTSSFSSFVLPRLVKKFGFKSFLGNNFIKLILADCEIDDEAFTEIVNKLSSTGNLRSATFSGNALTHESGKTVVELLNSHPCLTYLDLNSNKFGDQGIGEIVRQLETNTTLKCLYLMDNNVTEEGFNNIATMISKNSSINIFFFDSQQDVLNVQVFSKGLMSNHTLLYTDVDANDNQNNKEELENFSKMLNNRHALLEQIVKIIVNQSYQNNDIDIKLLRMYQTVSKDTVLNKIIKHLREQNKTLMSTEDSSTALGEALVTQIEAMNNANEAKKLIAHFDIFINTNHALGEVCKGGIQKILPLPLEIIAHIMQYDERSLWHSDIGRQPTDRSHSVEAIGKITESLDQLQL